MRKNGGFARQWRKVAKRLRPLIIILIAVAVKMKGFALLVTIGFVGSRREELWAKL
jgi:hypothetical protein